MIIDTLTLLLSEPGYYKEGDFGMRLENIVQVVPAEVKVRLDVLPAVMFAKCIY